ncbi:hypothetical protein ACFSHT_07130 [Paraburkholderia silviterrae]|uniref:Uncharacterized protein n=1 Tax=Paraburkholderia silviterrae TaxID=2528715 RepID=A0A4R5MD57_9BURK|nr:hypothetical protein [Paraburkholderia silviterrae]TDG24664.1 hypothetical protein EYW47_08930 [Paraburkholderia silviterrae]
MTTTIVQTISVADAAFMLHVYLGPIRSWTDFLTDNIRGRQSVAGHMLLPCARRHDGKSYRPVYAISDVRAFIEKVRKAIPSAGKTPIKTTALAIDSGVHWRVNRFDRDGASVARRSCISARYAHPFRRPISHWNNQF